MQLVSLVGQTTRFKGMGRKLGYPTANIVVKTNLDEGVYFGTADLDKYRGQPALIFIGAPITFGDQVVRLEAYLLDIEDQDYYDQNLRVNIMHFHRVNKKFKDGRELTKAMKNDEDIARAWFKSNRLLS